MPAWGSDATRKHNYCRVRAVTESWALCGHRYKTASIGFLDLITKGSDGQHGSYNLHGAFKIKISIGLAQSFLNCRLGFGGGFKQLSLAVNTHTRMVI